MDTPETQANWALRTKTNKINIRGSGDNVSTYAITTVLSGSLSGKDKFVF